MFEKLSLSCVGINYCITSYVIFQGPSNQRYHITQYHNGVIFSNCMLASIKCQQFHSYGILSSFRATIRLRWTWAHQKRVIYLVVLVLPNVHWADLLPSPWNTVVLCYLKLHLWHFNFVLYMKVKWQFAKKAETCKVL